MVIIKCIPIKSEKKADDIIAVSYTHLMEIVDYLVENVQFFVVGITPYYYEHGVFMEDHCLLYTSRCV